MSEAESKPTDQEPQDTTASATPRWRAGTAHSGPTRLRKLAIGSCLLASLAGTFIAFAGLPTPTHSTVLVSLYLHPGLDALGVDAPHPPTFDRPFALSPANHVAADPIADKKDNPQPSPASSSDPATAKLGGETPSAETQPSTTPTPSTTPSWRDAIAASTLRQQLVLHVSTMARVEQGQVYFYGKSPETSQETTISLAEVLAQLNKSVARNKLLILDVHWPTVSDAADSGPRLTLLNQTIHDQLAQGKTEDLHVLLAASDEGAARGMRAAGASLLSYCLTQSLIDAVADTDHDGRVSLAEAVAWAKPRIEMASSQLGPPQRIAWIPGASDFVFGSRDSTTIPPQRLYPNSLADGWRQRETYLADTRLPWLPETAGRWAQGLSQIESGWRRGESETAVQLEVAQLEEQCLSEIDAALAVRAQGRPDSLTLAAARMLRDHDTIDVDRLAQDLLTQYQEICDTLPPAGRTGPMGKAIAKYVSALGHDRPVVGLEALIGQFDRSVRIDRDALALIAAVREAWKNPPVFPITQAIDRLLAGDASDQKIATAIRLFRIHEQLGTDPAAISILSPRIDEATENFVVAQRLAWNPGMTLDAEVTRRIDAALVSSSAAWAAENTVSNAVRRLKVASQTIATDALVGVSWDHDRDYLDAQRRAGDLIAAIMKIRMGTTIGSGILTGELAVLRQTSEALDRQLNQMIQNHSDRLSTNLSTTAGLLSTTIPADVRTQILCQPVELNFDRDQRSAGHMSRGAPEMNVAMAMSDQPLICIQTLMQQVQSIAQQAATRYTHWLTDYVAQTATVDAIPIYRAIAQQRSIAGGDGIIPVAIVGDLTDVTWDTPSANIDLHYQVDLPDALPVGFEFLATAANCVQIHPQQGLLHPNQTDSIQFHLTPADENGLDPFVQGVWLRLTRGDESQLVKLAMPKQPTRPQVDIDFGPSITAQGRDVTLQMWPDNQAQSLQWQLRCHDPAIKAVIVKATSDSFGFLQTAPIAVPTGAAQPIRFLPPAAKPKATEALQASAAEDLIVTVTEAEKGTLLGRWRVATKVLDPRERFTIGGGEFRVAANGSNRLTVDIRADDRRLSGSAVAMPSPTFRLDLQPSTIAPLIDFGVSRLQSELASEQRQCQLFANNLRFEEGSEPTLSIPVAVNGDPGYFDLTGRFPRQLSRVHLETQQKPSIDLVAPAAIVPGETMKAIVSARRLADHHGLTVEVLGNRSAEEQVLWRKNLPTSRYVESTFIWGATTSTLQIVARRSDWQIDIPTHFGTGQHWLRVATTQPIGNQSVIAEQSFVLDDAGPTDIFARAESTSDRTTVSIQMRRNPSGIRAVGVLPAATVTDAKVKPMQAVRSADSDEIWSLAWPKSLPVPEQIELTITTVAGKTCDAVVDLPLQIVRPIGRIAGRVLEGAIGQPGLTVALSDPQGTAVAAIETAADGSYTFSVPPGTYRLAVEKPSTQRRAVAQVDAKDHKTTTTDLSLLRSS